MNNFLELKNIRKSFTTEKKINVLRGLSKKFRLGKIYSIMGPSGSGKSTLLNLISLIDKPSSGLIRFDNCEINFSEQGKNDIFRAKKIGLGGKTINLKLKTKNFKTLSRSKTINNPTQVERKIFKIAKELLYKTKDDNEYRLIGVGISELVDENFCDLDNLIDKTENNDKRIDQVINSLRKKFGNDIINHGKNDE